MLQHAGLRCRAFFLSAGLFSAFGLTAPAQSAPPPEAFRVLREQASGPQITPYLQYQTDLAWRQDEARLRVWGAVRTESDLLHLQAKLRQEVLTMLGGLPTTRTALHPRITGRISADGYHIEKLIFESLPGIYVSALVYIPDDHDANKKHPAILVAAGHAPNGKAHYQALCQRLVLRGYVVIAWDPVGQGERSQFWDAKAGKSRYNLICAEHAVLGNLAYLAGTNLARWEIWDGLRAFDYLLTRHDVDPDRINITGTSGGGFQAMHIAALEPRIKVAAISCYITSLPMRIQNRIFKDPDSDPEQDLYGMISNGVDNAGLMLLMYPRPIFIAAGVLDFFPIDGTEKAFHEVQGFYKQFGHSDRVAMAEGYHAHQFSDGNQERAFEFLDHFNGMPARTSLAPVKELEDKTVQCTTSGQVQLDFADAKPLTDEIRAYYAEHRKVQQPGSVRSLYLGSGHANIGTWTLTKFDGAPANDSQIAWNQAGTSVADDITIDRYVLHHSHNLVMPLLHVHNATNQRWILWFSRRGKADANEWPEIVKLIKAGYNVVTFDFRGLGETRMPYKAVSEDDPSLASLDYDKAYVNPLSSVLAGYIYNSLLTGRPYFLQMIEDAEIAIRFSRLQLHATNFSVASDSESVSLAAGISEALPGVDHLRPANAQPIKWSELVTGSREQWPIEYLLPGGAYIH